MKDGQCVGAEPVVGLKPCTGTPAEVAMKIKMGNVQLLEPHVREAKRHSADIIVFSEGALGIGGFDNPQGVNDEGGVASGPPMIVVSALCNVLPLGALGALPSSVCM